MMPSSRASVSTSHASRYLQQLCKHWSHRFQVTFDSEIGHVRFSDEQQVDLDAKGNDLRIVVTDSSSESLAGLERVVADHLQRFAHRETLDIQWSEAS